MHIFDGKNHMKILIMEDGVMKNIKNFQKEFQNMEMNGKKFKKLLKQDQVLKLDHMLKNFF